MRKIKRIQIEREVTDDVICNKCERSLKASHGYCGLLGAEVVGGFDSPKLGDCSIYQFDLCEYCLDELFFTFKIDPLVDDFDEEKL